MESNDPMPPASLDEGSPAPSRFDGKALSPELSGAELLLEVERDELARRIAKLRRKGGRHVLWALLGLSPGAFIPALGLMREGSFELLLVLVVLVLVTQVFLYARTTNEAARLEKELERLSSPD